MKLKISVISVFVIVGIFVCHSAIATPQPIICPSVQAIKDAGLKISEDIPEDRTIGVGNTDNYGTPQIWGFGVFIRYSATDKVEVAIELANKVLPTLSGKPLPLKLNKDNTVKWACIYRIKDYLAAAVTPIGSQ